MDCEAAREAMLECEPAELEGIGDTGLAAHVRACPQCGRRAAGLIADLRALDEALASLAGESGRDGVEDGVRAPADRSPRVASTGPGVPAAGDRRRGVAAGVSRRARWQRLWRLGAPVAAAAAVGALLLAWPRGGSGPGPGAGWPATRSGSVPVAEAPGGPPRRPELRVRVPHDARVTVFQTRDPSVAVVWFFPAPNGG